MDAQQITYIAGPSGSGKSTLARRRSAQSTAAGRTVEIISTDVVRAGLRGVFSREQHPELWAESFNVPSAEGDQLHATGANIDGFLRQCAPILRVVEAEVAYAVTEGWDVIVEGVHLVPGEFNMRPSGFSGHCDLVICLPASLDDHAAFFERRDAATSGRRPVRHYIENLPRIMAVQAFIEQRASTVPHEVVMGMSDAATP